MSVAFIKVGKSPTLGKCVGEGFLKGKGDKRERRKMGMGEGKGRRERKKKEAIQKKNVPRQVSYHDFPVIWVF